MTEGKPEYGQAELFIVSMLEKELSSALLYHNKDHTLDVLDAAMKISAAEKVPEEDVRLLRIAVLFHDAGFIHVYKHHEETGCEMAREFLPRFGLTGTQIAQVCEMIMSTKIPQNPKSLLDQIIADADLDYLGRKDVYIIAEKLHDEMKLHNEMHDEAQWIPFQIKFLKQHQYFTAYSRNLREPYKNQYLQQMIDQLNT
jgi:uncharacterized protein